MTTTISINAMQEVFTYPFKDAGWKTKFAIGAVIGIFNLLIFPVFLFGGYGYKILRNAIVDKQSLALPEWEDWGKLFVDGMKIFGVSIIYALPSNIVFLVTYSFIMIPMIQAEANGAVESSLPLMMLVFMLGGGLGMILVLPVQVILPVAITNMVAKDRFSAAFYIKELWSIFRANLGGFLLVIVINYGATMVLVFAMQLIMATLVLCIVLPFVMPLASFYLVTVSYGLYAWAYRDAIIHLNSEPLRVTEG